MSVLMAFTSQQIARLSGISERRLRYWEKTNVFRPTYIERRMSGPFRRIYAFRDLVSLRTLALLRLDYHLQLQELRRASDYLERFSESPWSEMRLRVQGHRLIFWDPENEQWSTAEERGQFVFTLHLENIRRESEEDARRIMVRTPDLYGKIVRNRYIMSNDWIFAGTRIPVAAVVGLRSAGLSLSEILRQYPSLHERDIEAASSFDAPTHQAA